MCIVLADDQLEDQKVRINKVVRKNLREYPQRRAYLVFVELPGMDDESRYHLCRALERNLSLPGPALVLWAGESPTLQQIERSAFEPIYSR